MKTSWIINTWKLPWSWSLHCSEFLSKASRVLPVLSQDNYSNPLIFPLCHNPGKNKLLKFFPLCKVSAYFAMATNPDTLVLVICLLAFFIGPCLYISLYTIADIIDCITLYLSPNHQPPFELGPETLVGCPDGLCYLAIFGKNLYDKVIQQIGHFPSIYALSTVPHYYRRQSAKGTFKLIGDNLSHYKPKIDGDPPWEIVDKLTSQIWEEIRKAEHHPNDRVTG